MLGGRPITLFHVRGIRIAVDWSWFIVLFLMIFWLSDFYGRVLDESSSSSTPFALAVVSALAFFASILLHELGHAFPPCATASASRASSSGSSAGWRGWTVNPIRPRLSSRWP